MTQWAASSSKAILKNMRCEDFEAKFYKIQLAICRRCPVGSQQCHFTGHFQRQVSDHQGQPGFELKISYNVVAMTLSYSSARYHPSLEINCSSTLERR
jgi:hypothetical protein